MVKSNPALAPKVLPLSRLLIDEAHDFSVMIQSYIAGSNKRNKLYFFGLLSSCLRFFDEFCFTGSLYVLV